MKWRENGLVVLVAGRTLLIVDCSLRDPSSLAHAVAVAAPAAAAADAPRSAASSRVFCVVYIYVCVCVRAFQVVHRGWSEAALSVMSTQGPMAATAAAAVAAVGAVGSAVTHNLPLAAAAAIPIGGLIGYKAVKVCRANVVSPLHERDRVVWGAHASLS